MALAAGATLAGFFGMNLASGLEEHPSAFYVATGAGIASMGGSLPNFPQQSCVLR